ncbi:MAG TPA: peptide chain release factor-like protein [Acidimicrobiales bacterium]|jgi:ribosome-associated protein|nr:peptide chain release factor-like protein [Acidimicrobiales bacterium]
MSDGDLVTRRGLRLPAAALDERFARGSGPGGQHRNVTASAVEVVADLTALDGPGADRVRERMGPVVRVRADESRSQWRNRTIARGRLAATLDDAATVVAPRRPTRPSRAAREARLEAKRRAAERKRSRAWRPESD